MAALKQRALRQPGDTLRRPVPGDAFADVSRPARCHGQDGMLYCTVTGSLDAVIKTAARFEVVNIISQEPSLEEIFLTFYGGGTNHAA